MVKLTPELIEQSMQYINPVRDRELDLRGLEETTLIFVIIILHLFYTYLIVFALFVCFRL